MAEEIIMCSKRNLQDIVVPGVCWVLSAVPERKNVLICTWSAVHGRRGFLKHHVCCGKHLKYFTGKAGFDSLEVMQM